MSDIDVQRQIMALEKQFDRLHSGDVPSQAPKLCFIANKGGSDQTGIVTVTYTKLTFTEVFDIGACFASSTWSPTIVGKVLVGTQVYMTTMDDTQLLEVAIYKNGATTDGARDVFRGSGTGGVSGRVMCLFDSDGNDTFEVYVFHSNGTNRIVSGINALTYFWGVQLS
jgi:hypothetical protein